MSADDGRIDEADAPTSPGEVPRHAVDDRRAAAAQRRLEAAERKAARRAERQSRGPGVWRSVVWPVLRLAVFAVIAVALVKVAFFPDAAATQASGDLPPTASMEEPLVAATVGTVRNDLALTGQVLPDDAVAVRSTQTGTISRILATNGQGVSAGSELYVVRVETPATQPNEDGSLPAPTVRLFTIASPAAGVLTGFEVLLNQEVQVGTETGSVQPATFHVDAPLTAQEQYRLTTQPTEAQVQIPGGPAPFTCTGLQVLQPSTGASSGAPGGDGATGVSTATARCQVPAEVRVFSGLAADVTIGGGVAEGVLTLPTTAVLGSADTGRVVRMGADGTQEEVQVELGLTDGQTIEIRGGLAEGDQVLQFVPGGEPLDDPCADPTSASYDPLLCGEVGP
ncbi:hypothetical protein [Agrococcus sp. SGAir0287]|uniref:hypothetical protein n=1 Tax=Agrococcus sp. SGAir0287 TaxID=2070347 RepID=UPI0015862407|nr:hypothetical protein [Agrococcus sp. SGAir0287]